MRIATVTLLALAGLTGCNLIRVNGKPLSSYGGGAAPASAPAPAGSAAPRAAPIPASNEPRPPAMARATLPAALGDKPMIVDVEAATSAPRSRRWDLTTYACVDSFSPAPLVEFAVTRDTSRFLRVALNTGADGILIEKPDGGAWVDCAQNDGQQPAVWMPQEGWTPGTYRVWYVSYRSPAEDTRELEVQFTAVQPARPENEVWQETCFADYQAFRAAWGPVEQKTRAALAALRGDDFYRDYARLVALYKGLAEQSAALKLNVGAAFAQARNSGVALEVRKKIIELQKRHGRDFGPAFTFNPEVGVHPTIQTGDAAFDRDAFCYLAVTEGGPNTPVYTQSEREPWWLKQPGRRNFMARIVANVADAHAALAIDPTVRVASDSGGVRSMKRVGRDVLFVLEDYHSERDCQTTNRVNRVRSDGTFEYQTLCSDKYNSWTTKHKLVIAADRLPAQPAIKVGDFVQFDVAAGSVKEGAPARGLHVSRIMRGKEPKTIAEWVIGEMLR